MFTASVFVIFNSQHEVPYVFILVSFWNFLKNNNNTS